MKPWQIPVIMIRCGGIKTAAPEKNARELAEAFQEWPAEQLELYAQALTQAQTELAEFDRQRTDPAAVARVVFTALQARKPKRRYKVGYMAGAAAMLEYLPQSLIDFIMAHRG